jgi:hypothetical protein
VVASVTKSSVWNSGESIAVLPSSCTFPDGPRDVLEVAVLQFSREFRPVSRTTSVRPVRMFNGLQPHRSPEPPRFTPGVNAGILSLKKDSHTAN